MEKTNRNTIDNHSNHIDNNPSHKGTCPKCHSDYVRQVQFDQDYFFIYSTPTEYTVSIPFQCMDCGNEFFNVYNLEYIKSED